MATQQEFKTNLMRGIANHFVDLIPVNIEYGPGGITKTINTVDDFRKIIYDGQLETVSGSLVTEDQKLVLYQQDYQSSKVDFDYVIDSVAQCYCGGVPNVEIGGNSHTCSDKNSYPGDNFDFLSIISTKSTNDVDGIDMLDFNIVNAAWDGCSGNQSVDIDEAILSILAQFIPFDDQKIVIDPTQAQQVLDTNIFELMPQQSTKQLLINKFFTDYGNLKGEYPNYVDEAPVDGFLDTPTDRDDDDISPSNPSGYIPRLDKPDDDINNIQNLQWLRDDLNLFLKDVDQQGNISVEDERPEYEDKTDGYLKIRHMNQAIIIRKEEGTDVGLTKEVSTTIPIDTTPTACTGPSYLCEGFTITMWVKFLDKVNSGTLFNFGNPLREEEPFGFMLETFVTNLSDGGTFTHRPTDAFCSGECDTERFIRLVVRDENQYIRDSHIGLNVNLPRLDTKTGGDTNGLPIKEYDNNNLGYVFNHTRVPIDLNEWYFIVANYNPFVDEDITSGFGGLSSRNPDYWRWNENLDGTEYSSYTGTGARCKVEIISKSDLIRARGFRSPEE